MTNNFNTIRKYMFIAGIPMNKEDVGDLFFAIMLVRRGKDHPDLPAANYTFKTYYVDSLDKYEKIQPEICALCDIFGLRAYVSVNVKSKEQFTKMCAFKFTQNILNNEWKKPWKVEDHVFGKLSAKNDDVWIVDVDDVSEDDEFIRDIKSIVNECDSKFKCRMIMHVPTKSGVHLLTHPFNLKQFNDKFVERFPDKQVCDVKKNHITLLYENLDNYGK